MASSLRFPARWHVGSGHPAHAPRARPFARGASAPEVEEITLGADGARSFHVGDAAMEVKVLTGLALVTCAGDPEDHVVAAGQTFRSERPGHHVVAAFQPTRVRIARG